MSINKTNSKDLCKVTVYWRLTRSGITKTGDMVLEYKKYPLDEELYKNIIKRFETGEITGQKIKPHSSELKLSYKRRFFENGKEIIPAFQELEHLIHQ